MAFSDPHLALSLHHTDPLYSLGISDDGHHLVAGSVGAVLQLTIAPQPTLIRQLGHVGKVTAVGIFANGNGVHNDKKRGYSSEEIQREKSTQCCVLSAGEDRSVRMFSVKTKQTSVRKTHRQQITCMAINTDKSYIATGSTDGDVILHTVCGMRQGATLSMQKQEVTAIAFSRHAPHLLAVATRHKQTHTQHSSVHIWNIRQKTLESTFVAHGATINSIAWHHTKNIIGTAADDHAVKIWELEKTALKKQICTFLGHDMRVNSIAFHPDGIHVFTASDDSTVCVFSLAEKGHLPLLTLHAHTAPVSAVIVAASGSTFYTAGHDAKLAGWTCPDLSSVRMNRTVHSVIGTHFNPSHETGTSIKQYDPLFLDYHCEMHHEHRDSHSSHAYVSPKASTRKAPFNKKNLLRSSDIRPNRKTRNADRSKCGANADGVSVPLSSHIEDVLRCILSQLSVAVDSMQTIGSKMNLLESRMLSVETANEASKHAVFVENAVSAMRHSC